MATTHSSESKHSNGASHGKGSTKDEAAAQGQKHVTQDQVGSGKEHDPNNFANNPERAAAAGHKGGKHSHDRD